MEVGSSATPPAAVSIIAATAGVAAPDTRLCVRAVPVVPPVVAVPAVPAVPTVEWLPSCRLLLVPLASPPLIAAWPPLRGSFCSVRACRHEKPHDQHVIRRASSRRLEPEPGESSCSSGVMQRSVAARGAVCAVALAQLPVAPTRHLGPVILVCDQAREGAHLPFGPRRRDAVALPRLFQLLEELLGVAADLHRCLRAHMPFDLLPVASVPAIREPGPLEHASCRSLTLLGACVLARALPREGVSGRQGAGGGCVWMGAGPTA